MRRTILHVSIMYDFVLLVRVYDFDLKDCFAIITLP